LLSGLLEEPFSSS
nr:immunoglobulin heavy chain junction region [Mus musculus]